MGHKRKYSLKAFHDALGFNRLPGANRGAHIRSASPEYEVRTCVFFGDLMSVAVFSLLGMLLRLRFKHDVSGPDWFPSMYAVVVSNGVGCMVIGAVRGISEMKKGYMANRANQTAGGREIHNIWLMRPKRYITTVGVTTGFCGSLTTFSSWMVAVLYDSSDVGTACAILGIGLGVAAAAVVLGYWIGAYILYPMIPYPLMGELRESMDYLVVSLLAVAGVITPLATINQYGYIWIPAFLGVAGSMIRHVVVSNCRKEARHIGTFICNFAGCLVAMLTFPFSSNDDAVPCTHCQYPSNSTDTRYYLQIGLAGGLSTVSGLAVFVFDRFRKYRSAGGDFISSLLAPMFWIAFNFIGCLGIIAVSRYAF